MLGAARSSTCSVFICPSGNFDGLLGASRVVRKSKRAPMQVDCERFSSEKLSTLHFEAVSINLTQATAFQARNKVFHYSVPPTWSFGFWVVNGIWKMFSLALRGAASLIMLPAAHSADSSVAISPTPSAWSWFLRNVFIYALTSAATRQSYILNGFYVHVQLEQWP